MLQNRNGGCWLTETPWLLSETLFRSTSKTYQCTNTRVNGTAVMNPIVQLEAGPRTFFNFFFFNNWLLSIISHDYMHLFSSDSHFFTFSVLSRLPSHQPTAGARGLDKKPTSAPGWETYKAWYVGIDIWWHSPWFSQHPWTAEPKSWIIAWLYIYIGFYHLVGFMAGRRPRCTTTAMFNSLLAEIFDQEDLEKAFDWVPTEVKFEKKILLYQIKNKHKITLIIFAFCTRKMNRRT